MIFYEPDKRDRRVERAISASGIDTAGLRPIARCGGPADYTLVERIFQMTRPTS